MSSFDPPDPKFYCKRCQVEVTEDEYHCEACQEDLIVCDGDCGRDVFKDEDEWHWWAEHIEEDPEGGYGIHHYYCPECEKEYQESLDLEWARPTQEEITNSEPVPDNQKPIESEDEIPW